MQKRMSWRISSQLFWLSFAENNMAFCGASGQCRTGFWFDPQRSAAFHTVGPCESAHVKAVYACLATDAG